MTDQQRQDAISTARQMTEALNGLSGRLDEAKQEWRDRDEFLTAYGRRNRMLAWLAGSAAFIALGLAVAVAVLFVQVSDNAATISDLHSTNVSACQAGNVSRSEQIQLWEHLVAVSKPAPGESAAQRRQNEETAAAFLGYVRHVFAPRDCAAVYRLKG